MKWIPLCITVIFAFLGLLHFYWVVFGFKKPELVLPTSPSHRGAKAPRSFLTALVGLILLFFSSLFLNQYLTLWDSKWLQHAQIVVGALFFVRAIGDFKYVGFFKSIKNTPFAKMDDKYYSPLCFLIAFLIALSVVSA